jgi:glycosyltransferase involved in cell wall biosynthesis
MFSVLQIGNTAGIANDIQRHLRAAENLCDIVIFYPDILKYGCDFDCTPCSPVRQVIPLYGIKKTLCLLKLVKNYDILHINSYSGFAMQIDYPLWKNMGLKIVHHFHGTDLRSRGKPWPMIDRYADLQYVSTPDLLEYAPEAEWLPTPMNLDLFRDVGIEDKEGLSEPLRIIHAVGSKMHGNNCKGTPIIIDAINRLKLKGYNIDFRLLAGVPYIQALEEYKQADIIIGQTHIGWYGKLEQEAMAFGKPVVTYIDPKFTKVTGQVPVMNFHRDDIGTLITGLVTLIEDYSLRERLSREGRAYVERWHDEKEVLKKIERAYETLLD